MIRVRKPAEPPAVLRTKGARARRTLNSTYSRAPRSYEKGKRSFAFDPGIYAHESVKQLAEQRRKHLSLVNALRQLIELRAPGPKRPGTSSNACRWIPGSTPR